MKLIIILLRFQILENYSSMGSKGQKFYNHFFLRLDSSGVRLVPGGTAYCMRDDPYPGFVSPVFARTWIPVAICVPIHLSVKLGQ